MDLDAPGNDGGRAALPPEMMLRIAEHLDPWTQYAFLRAYPMLARYFTFRHFSSLGGKLSAISRERVWALYGQHITGAGGQVDDSDTADDLDDSNGDDDSDDDGDDDEDDDDDDDGDEDEDGSSTDDSQDEGGSDPMEDNLDYVMEQFRLADVLENRDPENPDGDSLLHILAKHGETDLLKSILAWQEKASVDHGGGRDNDNDRQRLAPYIVSRPKQSLSIQPLNSHGVGPLHVAAANGHVSVVRMLLAYQETDLNLVDYQGDTPLLYAIKPGHQEIVDLLLQRDDLAIDENSAEGFTSLGLAASLGHDGIVKRLLDPSHWPIANGRDRSDRTALSWAASEGHIQVAKSLLTCGDYVDVNATDYFGFTPLLHASFNGHEEIVRLLLEQSEIETDPRTPAGCTALAFAVSKGYFEITKLLLGYTTNVNYMGGDGIGAIHIAARDGDAPLVELILTHPEADVTLTDHHGQRPLQWAARKGQEGVVRMLLMNPRVDVNLADHDGFTPLIRAVMEGHQGVVNILLERDDVQVNKIDREGRSATLWAVANSRLEMIWALLKRPDLDLHPRDEEGRTIFSAAVMNGLSDVVEYLLTQTGIDINNKDVSGLTPLAYAAASGFFEIVEMLLDCDDIAVNEGDLEYRNPLAQAFAAGETEIIELLLSRDDVQSHLRSKHGTEAVRGAVERALGGDYAGLARLIMPPEDDFDLSEAEDRFIREMIISGLLNDDDLDEVGPFYFS